MRTARRLKLEVEQAIALGEVWTPASSRPTVTLDTIALAYIQATVDSGAPVTTQRFRSSMIDAFLSFAGGEAPVGGLSISLLDRYAASLPAAGRQATTRHRKILEVERLWTWAAERPEQFPGIPTPRRITGRDIRPPPPVIAAAAPTWDEVDRMLAHLDQRPWHRRLGLLLRYTGLRCSQGLNLHWWDVDLQRGLLRIRAGMRGSKASRTRVVPLHPALMEALGGWGPADGLVLPGRGGQARRGDAPVESFRRAWRLSGVPEEKWGATRAQNLPGERSKARPTHAIRAAVRTGLIRLGVEEAVALYLVGHSQGLTAAAYVPEATPEESPYWARMVDAVGRIPRVGAGRAEG